MTSRQESRKNRSFYLERVCPMADDLLRFAYAVGCSRQEASQRVAEVCTVVAGNPEEFMGAKAPMAALFAKLLDLITANSKGSADHNDWIAGPLAPLNQKERIAVLTLDIMGLDERECCRITNWNTDILRKHAALGREKLLKF